MLIKVKVLSAAKKEEIDKVSEDSFLVKVKEKPLRGLANKKVRELLAKYFRVAQGNIRLIRGAHKTHKIFEIRLRD